MPGIDRDPPKDGASSLRNCLTQLAQCEEVSHVLEIGASVQDEWFEVLTHKSTLRPRPISYYRIDTSSERLARLANRSPKLAGLKLYHAASVPRDSFITQKQLRHLYVTNVSVLNQQPLEQALNRLEIDLKQVEHDRLSESGIEMVKGENGISEFDIVVLDGALFSGMADLRAVQGSPVIVVTRVSDMPGLKIYDALKADPSYCLESQYWGEGATYAVFRRKTVADQVLLPIHFFTIVLNGMPFIRHHIEVF